MEQELKNNFAYEEVKNEFEKLGLLTDDINKPQKMMFAAPHVNPKWTAARNACVKNLIKEEFGSAVVDTIVNAILAGNIIYAVKELAKRGFNLTVPGLTTLYIKINYECIKEANSKHKVYL